MKIQGIFEAQWALLCTLFLLSTSFADSRGKNRIFAIKHHYNTDTNIKLVPELVDRYTLHVHIFI